MPTDSFSRFQVRLCACFCACVFIAASCFALDVNGVVKGFEFLENPVWAQARDPKHRGYSFREVVPTVPARYRRLTPAIDKELCIVAKGEKSQPKMMEQLVVIGGGRATPVTLAVTPGTKVVFQNKDQFTHQLYGVDIKTFTAADLEKDAKRGWTVPAEGIFEFRDKRSPSLRIWIVSDSKIVTTTYPRSSGTFSLDFKNKGKYEVQAYFSGKKVGQAQVANFKGRKMTLKPLIVGAPEKDKK